jgi:hypothetical protein
MVRMILVTICAWLVGLVTYESWLRIVWRQSMGGDWAAVVFWSGVVFAVAALAVYAPAMLVLRKLLGGYKPVLWFSIVASMLGVLPTAIILTVHGGGFGDLISAEAIVFYVMFVSAGVTFGLGYALNRKAYR